MSHRTLQESFGREIYQLMVHIASLYENKCYDDRNEDFYRFCSKVINQFPDKYFRFISLESDF